MHTEIFSARIIHAINYLEFLTRKEIDHNALATPKPAKISSSLQMKNKQLQREHINKENFWKTCIKLLKF